MRVIHVLRKPLSEGTIAANTLKHGTGGINIDASRVGTEQVSTHSRGSNQAFPKRPGETSVEESGRKARQDILDHTPRTGRWPANVILQHLDGCRCDGVKKVRGSFSGKKSARDDLNRGHDDIYRDYGTRSVVAYNDKDGKETIANWICEPGCPVARLDEQSGITTTPSHYSYKRSGGGFIDNIPDQTVNRHWRTETGGASRFYKQVGGKADE